MLSAYSFHLANSVGVTQRSIGWCFLVGCRYWPIVKISTPTFLHVLKHFFDFFLSLADAEHDAGLRGEAAGLGVFEHPEGAVVAGGLTDWALEAFDRLEVVIENIGAGRRA